jgi:hypothetical protein
MDDHGTEVGADHTGIGVGLCLPLRGRGPQGLPRTPPHFPVRVTDRIQDRHRLGQRTLRPEPMVVLEPWAFILRKEANHDEDIAKTRAASFSRKPRNLSAL